MAGSNFLCLASRFDSDVMGVKTKKTALLPEG